MDFFSQYHYYLSLFCGCAFLFFSLSCFLLWRAKFGKLSYFWIMLFGFSFAVIKFMQMSASGGDPYDIGKYSLAVSVMLYVCMLFFFMSAQDTYLKFKPGNKIIEYLMVPCSLLCMIAGFCFGLKLFNASVFIFLWLPASFIMTGAVYNINKHDKYARQSVFYIFVGFTVYCIVYAVSQFGIMLRLSIAFQSVCNAALSVIVFFIASLVFKYFKVSHEKNVRIYDYMPVYWRHIPIGSMLFAILVGGLFFTMYLENYSRNSIKKDAGAAVMSVAETITAQLNKSDQISDVIANSPFVKDNMPNPGEKTKNAVNAILEDYRKAFNAAAVLTADKEGEIIFHSEISQEKNPLKINVKYRPYFTQALNGRHGSSFSRSFSGTGQSYFSAHPVLNKEKEAVGAVIVQENIGAIVSKLRRYKNIFVIDANGTVLLSDRDDIYFGYMWPLYAGDKDNKKNLNNILPEEPSDGEIVVLNGGQYYVAKKAVGKKGWSVIYFNSLNPVKQFKALGVAAVCGALIIALLLFWSINQSNRILALALQHKAILNSAKSIAIVATDVKGGIILYGQGSEDIMGYTREEFIKKGIGNIMFNKDGRPMSFEEAVSYSSSPGIEIMCRRKDGTVITLLISVLPQYSVGSKLIGYIFSGADITVTKETETELAQQIKFLQMLIDGMPIAVYYKDGEMHIIGCNKAFEAIMEHSKDFMIGKKNDNIYFDKEAGEESKRTDEIVASEMSSVTYERIVKFRKSSPRNLIYYKSPYKKIDGKFAGIIGVILDATQERKMQTEREVIRSNMIQQNKLAALGELAGSIAHELNNPLSIILGFAQVLVKDKTFGQEVRNAIENIYEAAKRSRSIITNMLEFARSDTSRHRTVQVNDIIESSMLIIEKDFNKASIEIRRNLAKDAKPITANPMQIQQVFLNILLNAKDAIPEGGKVTVETENRDKYLIVNISDTGSGIAKEVLSKIFDPFFTTKVVGKGTGLGLSICYGIINAHKGDISVKSVPGKGTAFTIKFPVDINK